MDDLSQSRAAARRTALPPLTDDMIRTVANSLNPWKAIGVDAPKFLDIRRFPRAGRRELINLLHDWERELALPWQLLINFIAELPNQYGTGRAIGFVARSVRFLCAARGASGIEWLRNA